MNYLAFKHFHMLCAASSGSLFLLRGVWMLGDSPMLARRWVKVLPHVVDTLLLASALVMVIWSAQYPFVQGWLTAKLVALLAYIVLGTIALKRGENEAHPDRRLCCRANGVCLYRVGRHNETSHSIMVSLAYRRSTTVTSIDVFFIAINSCGTPASRYR